MSNVSAYQNAIIYKNWLKDRLLKNIEKIFFPFDILLEDIKNMRVLIWGEIKVFQWDKTLFRDKYTIYIRHGMHTCILSKLTYNDLIWFYTDMQQTKGKYIIKDICDGEPIVYELSKRQKNILINKLRKLTLRGEEHD